MEIYLTLWSKIITSWFKNIYKQVDISNHIPNFHFIIIFYKYTVYKHEKYYAFINTFPLEVNIYFLHHIYNIRYIMKFYNTSNE